MVSNNNLLVGMQTADDVPIKVIFSSSQKYLFFFKENELVMSLTAGDFQAIKDMFDKERSYMDYTRKYLSECRDMLGADFYAVTANDMYVEELNKIFANKMRSIQVDIISDEIRHKLFQEALQEIDFRFYINMVDLRGA